MSTRQLESLDHCGLGSWDPGAEEDGFGEWIWANWDTVQPAQNPMQDERDTTAIRAWDILELEIPEEDARMAYVPPDLTLNSNTPSSTFTKCGSLVLDDSPAKSGDDGPAKGMVTKASSTQDAASSANQWLCEDANCSKAFGHRFELKYVISLGRILFLILDILCNR